MEDIHLMTVQLAADPGSLVFLELGEALRQRGQFDAALAVGEGGLQRYPSLPDAHDLVGRIRSDRREGDEAFDAWTMALRLDPGHLGALRGLAFLAFREGDLERAGRHLRAAIELAPGDPSLTAALRRVEGSTREGRTRAPTPAALPDDMRSILVDGRGRVLGGRLRGVDGQEVSESVAAELAGIMREAARTARFLNLGTWLGLAVECGPQGEEGCVHVIPPTDSTVLFMIGQQGRPPGQLALEAEAAAAGARRWLERFR